MARQLFGTDGIRGNAGEPPLDKPTAFALGAALGAWAKGQSSEPKVLLGMDTRDERVQLADLFERFVGAIDGFVSRDDP